MTLSSGRQAEGDEAEGEAEGVESEAEDVTEEEAMPEWLRRADATMTAHPPSETLTLSAVPSAPLEEPAAPEPLPRRGAAAVATAPPPPPSPLQQEEDAATVAEPPSAAPSAVRRHTTLLCEGRSCLELVGLYPPALLQHLATQRVELLTHDAEAPKVFFYVSNRTLILGEYVVDPASYVAEAETYRATRRHTPRALRHRRHARRHPARCHKLRQRMQERR